jgi:hypothetical protein
MVLAGKLHIVHMDGRARAALCGERYVDRFEGVGLHSPFLEPGLDCEEMGLKFLDVHENGLGNGRHRKCEML